MKNGDLLHSLGTIALRLSIVSTLLIGVAILVGQQQPPSAWITFLHLNDCELPCWIGIEPGKTTLQEAEQQVIDVYNIDQYELSVRENDRYLITNKFNGHWVNVGLGAISNEESPQSVVMIMDFEFGVQIDNPTIGELYRQLGAAESVDALPSQSPTQGLYWKDQRVEIVLDGSDSVCNQVRPTQSIYQILSSASSLGLNPQEYRPPSLWHGFNRCN